MSNYNDYLLRNIFVAHVVTLAKAIKANAARDKFIMKSAIN